MKQVNAKIGLDDFLVANGLDTGDLARAKAAFERLPSIPFARTLTADENVEEMNRTFAVVTVKGQTLILEEVVRSDEIKEVQYLRLTDLKLRMSNRFAISPEGKEIKAATAWLEHPKRREYSRVVFEPGGAPPPEYNLWQGLNVTPVPGDCSLILNHIKDVICNGDEDAFEYTISWCADIVQNPANRPGVAIALRGDEGVGKGVFAQMLMKLTTPHSVQVTQGQQITGRFNSIIEARLFIFMDEAFWAGDKQSEGVLKGLITERELIVEHKGKEPLQVSNYSRILTASNSDWVVPAGHGARRYLVLDVVGKYKGNGVYFKTLIDHIENGGLEAFAEHLMRVDLSKVDLRKPPKTKALLDQKLESMGSSERFIHEMLNEGSNGHDRQWSRATPVAELHQRYIDANKALGERWLDSQNKFGKWLKKVLKVEQQRVTINHARPHAWIFPPLEICRKRFDQYMDADLEWPDSGAGEQGQVPPPRKTRKYQ